MAPNSAKAAILMAAVLAIHPARAADPATSTAPPTPDGAQLFTTHCAMCHKPAELARRLQNAADPKAARADMAAFIARHGRSDAAADAAIIDYLANSAAP
jgi:mono/diheme cytochrome c family protein